MIQFWDIRVPVETLPHAADLRLPGYQTAGAAGMDLRAAIPEPHALAPGHRFLCPTGLKVAIPAGYEGQVRARSGLALEHGVTCLNSPGTVDSDYRGELKVILANLGTETFLIERGTRVAQIVFAPVVQATWMRGRPLDATTRGEAGFGSTGR